MAIPPTINRTIYSNIIIILSLVSRYRESLQINPLSLCQLASLDLVSDMVIIDRTMRAYWHGDIDLDNPTHYYCQHHRCTHIIKGMRPAEWSDLYYAVHMIIPLEQRALNHPNIFRDAGKRHYRINGRWKPYPEAPPSFACHLAPVGTHRPIAIVLTELTEWLEPWPDALQAVQTRAHAIIGESFNPPAPETPREETRKRVYAHGDIHDTLTTRYYCSYHNAWHLLPAPAPLPGDIFYAQRAKGYTHQGRREFRPTNPPTAWTVKRKAGRPPRLPTEPSMCFTCVKHDSPILHGA